MDKQDNDGQTTQDDILKTVPTLVPPDQPGVVPPEKEEPAPSSCTPDEEAPSEAFETAATMVAPVEPRAGRDTPSDPEKPAGDSSSPEPAPAGTTQATQAVSGTTDKGKTESKEDSTVVLSKPPPPSRLRGILQPGEMLGKYRIEKRLGKGGMGEVYLGKHEQLGILRAIKVLPVDLAKKNSQFFTRFLREAKPPARYAIPMS